jgi:putative oxidoreductase
MKKQTYILVAITILLLTLWAPTSLNKILDFESFKQNIYNQPFNINITQVIIYSIPLLEITTVLLIVIPKYRLWGFILSTILMSIFTIYIAAALLKVWDKIPCGCGLIISGMKWHEHLWFNSIFLILSATAWYIQFSLQKNSTNKL